MQDPSVAHTAAATTGTVDVVVVGAGVTGLTAATRLRDNGLDVVVLEARDRVGGRLLTDDVDGVRLEVGGQWVSPDQTALLAMLDELGLDTYPRYREGASVYIGLDGARSTFTGAAFPVPDETAAEIDRLTATLDRLAAGMDPLEPWEHPDAEELDRVSFAEWLGRQTDDAEARDNVALYVGPAMLTKPDPRVLRADRGADGRQRRGRSATSSTPTSSSTAASSADCSRCRCGSPSGSATPCGVGAPVTAVGWDDDGAIVTVRGRHVPWRGTRCSPSRRPWSAGSGSPRPAGRPAADAPAPVVRARHQAAHHLRDAVLARRRAVRHRVQPLPAGARGLRQHQRGRARRDSRHPRRLRVRRARRRRCSRCRPTSAAGGCSSPSPAYYGDGGAAARTAYYESPWMHDEWTAGAYATSFDIGSLTRYGPRPARGRRADRLRAPATCAGLGFQHVDGAIRMGEDVAKRFLEV